MVRALVYQWPSFDSWHVSFRVSYYNWKPDHAAAIYRVFVNYMLMGIPALGLCTLDPPLSPQLT